MKYVVRFAPRSVVEDVGQYKEIAVEADSFEEAQAAARETLEPTATGNFETDEWVWLSSRIDT